MSSIHFLSTTIVESWSGADLSQLGPIYPMVGSEKLLVILGILFWLGFHLAGGKVERREMDEDEAAAKSPDRLKRVFAQEAKE